MIIDCISDLHGFYPELPGGDLLIVAGDFTKSDKNPQYCRFLEFVYYQNYSKKVIVSGNHDNFFIDAIDISYIRRLAGYDKEDVELDYLCDSGTEFEGLKIWGSPWTTKFKDINPKCCAFTVDTDEELNKKWKLIPEDTNILITHYPPFGIFDEIPHKHIGRFIETGSRHLRNRVIGMPNLKLHVFGHIHEHGGKVLDTTLCKFVNASHVNEKYKPVNGFVRIEL